MKITKVQTYFFNPNFPKNLLLCRVETDNGLYGWGEAYVLTGKEKPVEEYINSMGQYIIGRDPFLIRHTGQAMFNDFAFRRSSGEFYAAWSAIEIAMWDILGKHLGQPVYNLLGGPSRERVRVYASGWTDASFGGENTPQGIAERAVRVKAMGFNALKWDPLLWTRWRPVLTKQDEDFAVESIRLVREAVGPDVELLLDFHRRFTPYYAARFADLVAEFNIDSVEEPCPADNLDLLVEAKKHIRQPVVTGETLYTKYEFRNVFEKTAAEIINPDLCSCGGITGLLDIATMAEPYGVLVSPHNFNSTAIGMAATVHASAVIPNFNITEYFVNLEPVCNDVVVEPLHLDQGFIDLPDKPGIGIDIDLEKLAKYPYKERKVDSSRGIAKYTDEYPRKEAFIR